MKKKKDEKLSIVAVASKNTANNKDATKKKKITSAYERNNHFQYNQSIAQLQNFEWLWISNMAKSQKFKYRKLPLQLRS